MVNVTPKQCGKNVRMNFGKINEVLEMPNLIEVQKNSYRWFREEGLKEVFRDVSSITDYNGNLVLNFIDYRIDEKPKYTIAECKEQDATYAAALRVTATLWNKETGEVKESEIYMGDFPLMTESGTFVINGAERVIVSQLVRSPGVYYASEKDRTGKDLFKTTVIPNRGAWLEYEMDFRRSGGRFGGSPRTNASFEDKLSKFLKDSDERLTDLRRKTDSKRGGRGSRRD